MNNGSSHMIAFLLSWYFCFLPLVSAALVVHVDISNPTLIQRTAAVDSNSYLGVIQASSGSTLLRQLVVTSFVEGSSSGTANPDIESWENSLRIKISKFDTDEVIRVIDPNTVKLKRAGLVSFAAVRTPSGYSSSDKFRFPDCIAKSPVSKAKQLLPKGTEVKVKIVGDVYPSSSNSANKSPALIVLASASKGTSSSKLKLVNAELVREGFARTVTRGRDETEKILPGLTDGLQALQKQAESDGLGMYKQCELVETAADDQFEPLDVTVETRYGDDGGKQFLKQREVVGVVPPNPGDVRKCADFDTFEDALRWYDRYLPYYGDVAKLDRDGDGVPCSGLPHTTNQDRYRMKKPNPVVLK